MNNYKIAVIGLGYVGLPLAIEFGKKYDVYGFDIDNTRLRELRNHNDRTLEINSEELKKTVRLKYCSSIEDLRKCNIYIVTVPTPIDKYNKPNLLPLLKASQTVGKILKKGDIVIYESTVYPGATEEECVPVLVAASGLIYNEDFFCGYSPERINPGDKQHTVSKILKVTSGSTPEVAEHVDLLYKSIIVAGTHKASCIKVAEAAKVIENAQRDINIAFVNELSKIFNKLGIDTHDVLNAAGTKWNFLKFKPGLVGGHCIGVDPYYLAQKAQAVGYHPEIILAGRRLNDEMGAYIAQEMIKLMVQRDIAIKGSKVLVLGFTFKENCPDVRNTKVIDIINELKTYNVQITVFDPWANPDDVRNGYGFDIASVQAEITKDKYEGIVLAVGHDQFKGLDLKQLLCANSVVYDVKSFFPKELTDKRL